MAGGPGEDRTYFPSSSKLLMGTSEERKPHLPALPPSLTPLPPNGLTSALIGSLKVWRAARKHRMSANVR